MATSTSATSSAATTPIAGFVGTSTYSSQFASEINREVAIASLPVTQLQSDQTALNAQSTALGSLDSDFTNLQTAITSIDTAVSGSSFSTTIDQQNALTANVGDGASEGNYS